MATDIAFAVGRGDAGGQAGPARRQDLPAHAGGGRRHRRHRGDRRLLHGRTVVGLVRLRPASRWPASSSCGAATCRASPPTWRSAPSPGSPCSSPASTPPSSASRSACSPRPGRCARPGGSRPRPAGSSTRSRRPTTTACSTQEEFAENEQRIAEVARLAMFSTSPLERLERALSPWVAYVVVPVFALANAGVSLSGDAIGGHRVRPRHHRRPARPRRRQDRRRVRRHGHRREGWASGASPPAPTWRHVLGLATVGGRRVHRRPVRDQPLVRRPRPPTDAAKVGILVGSTIAGILGFTILRTSAGYVDGGGRQGRARRRAGEGRGRPGTRDGGRCPCLLDLTSRGRRSAPQDVQSRRGTEPTSTAIGPIRHRRRRPVRGDVDAATEATSAAKPSAQPHRCSLVDWCLRRSRGQPFGLR